MKIIGFILLFATAMQAQNFELHVEAKTVIPGRKIYLEYVNEQGKVAKVDSASPSAQRKVTFKGQVKDQGAFYLVNFFDTPKPQKVLLILEGGETIDVVAGGPSCPATHKAPPTACRNIRDKDQFEKLCFDFLNMHTR